MGVGTGEAEANPSLRGHVGGGKNVKGSGQIRELKDRGKSKLLCIRHLNIAGSVNL